MSTDYSYFGSGKIYVREYGTNNPLVEVGNCSTFNLSPQVESKELPDYTTPGGGLANSFERNKGVDMSYTFHDFSSANLARALRGGAGSTSAASATDEAHAAYASGFIPLDKIPSGASIVVTDMAGTTTYTENTDYEIRTGGIYILPGTTIPAPVSGANNVKIDYAYNLQESVEVMTASAKFYEMVFAGLNEARSGKASVIRCYKVSHGVMSQFAAIGQDYGAGEVTGKLTIDSTKTGAGISKYAKIQLES